jgi:selenide,water dikinase
MGIIPGGLNRNRKFRMNMIEAGPGCPEWIVDVLFDPQTSGGLLISLPSKEAEALVKRMNDEGIKDAAIIGEVVPEPKGKILVL